MKHHLFYYFGIIIALNIIPLCFACESNEEYNDCGSACEPSCDNPHPTICTEQCVSGCFCKKGYVRDLNTKKCVDIQNCTCSYKNSEFNSCGSKCPPTCSNPRPGICILLCVPGCFCTNNTIRDTQSGQCVPINQCKCNLPNEIFMECGTACEKTCENPEPRICTKQCVSGCFCEKGYIRDYFGNCIKEKQCLCPPNEVYSKYGSQDEPTCQNPNPKVSNNEKETFKCICSPGYIREKENGKCIKENDCPCILPNEEFSNCGSCYPTCTNMNPQYCTFDCKIGCFCVNGTIRDECTGLCVKPENCKSPEIECPANEILSCKTECEPTCDDFYPGNCSKGCVKKCYCKDGKCSEREYCCDGKLKENSDTVESKAFCKPGCICKKGYVRKDIGKRCIKIKNCPRKSRRPCRV